MRPPKHIIASLTIGAALSLFTKSIYAGLLCFICGIFVDFDHVIEYIVHYGWENITFKKIYHVCEGVMFSKVYLVFHIGEIAILLWAATIYTKNVYLLAVALGYSSHLILDCIGNQAYPSFYFMSWRAINKFDKDKFFKEKFLKD